MGLTAEHTWPSGGGDAGIHLLGSARAYVGTQSQVSSSGTDGRLMWTSDTSRFFHVGSGGTSYIGGPRVISAGSYPNGAAPQRYIWAEEWGGGVTNSSGNTVITFPNSGFSVLHWVGAIQLEPATIGSISALYATSIAGASVTMNAVALVGASSQSSVAFNWRALGTRIL